MKVPYGEGIASHAGAESCVGIRKDVGGGTLASVWICLFRRDSTRSVFFIPVGRKRSEHMAAKLVRRSAPPFLGRCHA
jgi:hypothetical protein